MTCKPEPDTITGIFKLSGEVQVMVEVITIGATRLAQLRSNGHKFASVALWPEGIMDDIWGQNLSTDTHDEEGMARHVCKALSEHGYGGFGVRPLKVWTIDLESTTDTISLEY